MKYKTATIEWWDATSKSEWVNKKNLPALSHITTRGYVVRKTKTSITICASVSGEDMGDCITIPRPWVVKED